jgi:hypothetical protein
MRESNQNEPRLYREAVNFIKRDPLSLGALVTTHKIDLYRACRQIFDSIDPLADSMKSHVVHELASADAILGSLKPGSLIVNVTGLGKDAPGPR